MALLTDEQILDTDLLEALGLTGASDEDRARVVNNVVTLVLKTAMLQILDALAEEKKKEFANIIEKNGAESREVTVFLESNVEHFAEILQAALLSVKRDLIAREQEK